MERAAGQYEWRLINQLYFDAEDTVLKMQRDGEEKDPDHIPSPLGFSGLISPKLPPAV
jgi:hypothetical protein